MAGGAVSGTGWNMSGGFGLSAVGALAGIGTIVAGVAAAGADRRVAHCVSRKARRGIDVAIAALDSCHWNMRRRGVAGRRSAVVAG